ncbi:MAG: AAA family ATPase [Quisquiliibacterium sp.]
MQQFAPTKPALQMVICQSEADAEAVKRAGLRSVRAIADPVGVFLPGTQDLAPGLDVFEKFILVPRDDCWLEQTAIRLGDLRCRWVPNIGQDDVAEQIREARPMWTDELCVMSDIPEATSVRTFDTGFDLLDQHGLRLPKSGLMTVIGPYGSGKSVWLRQLACNLYKRHHWRTCITAFEEKVRPRYERDLGWYLAEKRFSAVDRLEQETLKRIDDAFVFLRRKRNTVLDLNRLLDRLEYAIAVYGCDAVVIDPVNEIDHIVPKGQNKSDYMADFLMSLKRLADDYGALMIVAAHPPKDTTSTRKRTIYTLNDGADTAHYGNKSDIGLCIWRPTSDSATYMNFDKSKDHDEFGKPTFAKMVLARSGIGFHVADIGESVFAEIVGE